MKTLAILAAAGFAAGVAVLDHIQIATVTCKDQPKETATITAPCRDGAGANGGYGGGQGGQSGYNGGTSVTVTVTETQTITQSGSYASAPTGDEDGDNIGGGIGNNGANGGGSTYTGVSLPTQTYMVQVGAFDDPLNPGRKLFEYRPNNITAKKGDTVKFQMLAAAHSVTQSNFMTPCTNDGGFDTDLVNNTANAQNIFRDFEVKDDSRPLWFYCKQKNPVSHCSKGMVFGINPKSQEQMQQFIDMAKAQEGNGTTTTPPISTGTGSSSPVQTHEVQVGAFDDSGDSGKKLFQFRLNQILAEKGDVVNFQMMAAAHSVTQSAFAKPCVTTGPFDTELVPVAVGAQPIVKTYTVEDTSKSLWFYCKQKMPVSHCGAGMVFSINARSDAQMQQFVDMAIRQNGTAAGTQSASVSTNMS